MGEFEFLTPVSHFYFIILTQAFRIWRIYIFSWRLQFCRCCSVQSELLLSSFASFWRHIQGWKICIHWLVSCENPCGGRVNFPKADFIYRYYDVFVFPMVYGVKCTPTPPPLSQIVILNPLLPIYRYHKYITCSRSDPKCIGLVGLSLTSLCHSNGHIEAMPHIP